VLEDKKMWMNAELDEQIDKWRSLQGKDAVPAKPTVKNRALELAFTVQVIEHDRLVNETAAQTQYNVEDDPMAEREGDNTIPPDYELQHVPSF
jgi:hypothetical protein